MNILWLYKYLDFYDFDNWLHMKFAEAIANTKGVNVLSYGPGLKIAYPKTTKKEYNSNTTLHALRDILHFDVVILNTKSRMFDYYNPATDEARGCWLPPDFKEWKHTPKIVIEEDYHYEKNDNWYAEYGIDLILQRHYSQVKRQQKVPMKWFPFSVDSSVFNPSNRSYDWRIAFVGNSNPDAYKYRESAIIELCKKNLCVSYKGNIQKGDKYVELLKRYSCFLSCGSTYEICAAKNFEIMSSGALLFTNKFEGIDLLFDPNCYQSYANDCSDILDKANEVINDRNLIQNKIQNGLNCITNRHTHQIRISKLLNIISEEKGKE